LGPVPVEEEPLGAGTEVGMADRGPLEFDVAGLDQVGENGVEFVGQQVVADSPAEVVGASDESAEGFWYAGLPEDVNPGTGRYELDVSVAEGQTVRPVEQPHDASSCCPR
jgi:hypothetical protein